MNDTQDNALLALAGRVLLAFGSLLVLGAMAAAMVALAYWSKYDLQTTARGAAPSNASITAPAP